MCGITYILKGIEVSEFCLSDQILAPESGLFSTPGCANICVDT